jgi:dihydrofolate reductase
MIISIVVAASTNHVIGNENKLPWHLPNDLKFFKNKTWGLPVIMGRNTFESLNGKPLKGRVNLVLTNQKDWSAEGATSVSSVKEAVLFAHKNDYKEVMLIGGAQVFKENLTSAQNIYLTRIHSEIIGDVFFPELNEKEWELKSKVDHCKDEKHAYDYSFEHWVKKD